VLLAPYHERGRMKYICLGYIEPGKFEGMTEDERNAVFDDCFEHNDHLRANGHFVGEMALQSPETAVTLYWKNGKVATTDGPYAETKEQLGGISILEARPLPWAFAASRTAISRAVSAYFVARSMSRMSEFSCNRSKTIRLPSGVISKVRITAELLR
jgi:hypothetical protein